MTVIIAYATPDLAFLAADSFRWDLLERRNVGPVRKLHVAGPTQAFAIGGVLIDRTRLAAQLCEAHAGGEALADAARRLTPLLFAATRALPHAGMVTVEQFCVSWYAEAGASGCRVQRHRLPEDRLDTVSGLDVMGPDTQWLAREAATLALALTSNGRLALDDLAYRLIGQAAARHPSSVGYPAMACVLHADSRCIVRDDLHPQMWVGPRHDFSVLTTPALGI